MGIGCRHSDRFRQAPSSGPAAASAVRARRGRPASCSSRSCQGAGRTRSGNGAGSGVLRRVLRHQVGRQPADRRVVEAEHDVFVARRLPLALQVVARLEDRPQRSVLQGRNGDPMNQPCELRPARSRQSGSVRGRSDRGRPGGSGRRGCVRAMPHRRLPMAADPAGTGVAGLPRRRRRAAQLPQQPLQRLERHPQPVRQRVENLGLLEFQAVPVRVGHRGSGCPGPTRPPAASPRSSRDRTAPRPAPADTPADRRPARASARNAAAPSFRRKSHGSRFAGQGQHSQVQFASQEEFQRPIRRRSDRPDRRRRPARPVGQPAQRPEMIFSQRRPQRAHDVT